MTADPAKARYDGAVPIRKADTRVSKAFGRALKIARVRADLSREEVAQAAGLRRADEIGRFERGDREPALSVFMAIARALGLTTATLLAATEQELRDARPPGATTMTSPTEPAKRPLALAVIVQDGRLLMTRRRFKEQVVGAELDWNLVVGEIEADETPEAAAVREAAEEVGLVVRAVGRIFDHVHPKSPDRRHFYYIGCEVVSGAPELVDHEENREVTWCTLEEADRYVAPYGGFAPAVRQYLVQTMAAQRR